MSIANPALTLQLITEIGTGIRAGAFERVAVEATGTAWTTYQDWLLQGNRPDGGKEQQLLVSEVRQALAWARLRAEMELHETDAKTWLLQGPGRDSPKKEGWGSAAKAGGDNADEANSRLFDLCAVLVEALDPFPEARAAAAEAIARWRGPHSLGD